MITIICATNRPKNQTLKVVEVYKSLIEEQGEEVSVFQMAELPSDFIVTDTFGNRTKIVSELIQNKIVPADKLVVISPEYNGSYPGVFKAFLDGVSPSLWHGKKAALVGVASGRAGNLRGMDHLTHVLHHLKVEVYSAKVPISKLDDLLDDDGSFVDADTVQVLRNQLKGFLKF